MDSEETYNFIIILSNLVLFTTLIPLILIVSIKTRTYFTVKWVLFILLGLGLIIDFILQSPKIDIGGNFMYNIYTIVCITTSVVIYNKLLSDSFSRKLSFYSLLILLSIFLAFIIYQKDLSIDSSLVYLIFSIIVVILSFLYFRTLLNEMKVINLFNHPPFWIVFAYLTYYGGTMSLTLFQDYIIDGKAQVYETLWSIQLIANIIFSILISISVWKMRKT